MVVRIVAVFDHSIVGLAVERVVLKRIVGIEEVTTPYLTAGTVGVGIDVRIGVVEVDVEVLYRCKDCTCVDPAVITTTSLHLGLLYLGDGIAERLALVGAVGIE